MTEFNLYTNVGKIIKVTASTLNVRSGPSTSNSIVKTIPQNSKWYILDVSGNWYKIATNQWISATYTAISTPLKTVQVTVNTLNVISLCHLYKRCSCSNR